MSLVGKAAALAVLALVVAGGAVSAAAAPKVYVGLFRDDAVAVIDTSTNTVLRTVPVPKGPHGLVVTPRRRQGLRVERRRLHGQRDRHEPAIAWCGRWTSARTRTAWPSRPMAPA